MFTQAEKNVKIFKRFFKSADNIGNILGLDKPTTSSFISLYKLGGLTEEEITTQVTVPEKKHSRVLLKKVSLSPKEKTNYLKYMSQSGKRFRNKTKDKSIEKHVIKKSVPTIVVNLDKIEDAKQRLVLYDYFNTLGSEIDPAHMTNPHVFKFIKITGDGISKASTKVLTDNKLVKVMKILPWYITIVEDKDSVATEVEELDDDDRLNLIIQNEVKKAIVSTTHPLHNKVKRLLETMNIDLTEETVDDLSEKFNVKDKRSGTDEVL